MALANQFDMSFIRDGSKFKPEDSSGRILMVKQLDFAWSPPKQCAFMGARLWQDTQFTDCTIVTGGETISCHRSVLAAASPVFRQMFASGMREATEQRLEVGDAPPKAVSAMISFIYTGEIEPYTDDFVELLLLADKYQVVMLAVACYPRIVENLTVDNVVTALRCLKSFADEAQCKDMWDDFCHILRNDDKLFEVVLKAF